MIFFFHPHGKGEYCFLKLPSPRNLMVPGASLKSAHCEALWHNFSQLDPLPPPQHIQQKTTLDMPTTYILWPAPSTDDTI